MVNDKNFISGHPYEEKLQVGAKTTDGRTSSDIERQRKVLHDDATREREKVVARANFGF